MKETSKWWWIGGNHNNTSSSSSAWLNSTLSELDAKTKDILRVIDEVDDEADTFVKRAKNYYEKKPKLIAMVEDSYRSHRSLAHKYDLLIKHSPLVPHRHNPSTPDEFRSDSCEETEFEVDDGGEGENDQTVEFGNDDGEKMKEMKEELERLREENRVYKEMMSEKRRVTSLFTTNSIIRQQQQQIETKEEAKASMSQIKVTPLPPPSSPSNATKPSFDSAQPSSTTNAEKASEIVASSLQRLRFSDRHLLKRQQWRRH